MERGLPNFQKFIYLTAVFITCIGLGRNVNDTCYGVGKRETNRCFVPTPVLVKVCRSFINNIVSERR